MSAKATVLGKTTKADLPGVLFGEQLHRSLLHEAATADLAALRADVARMQTLVDQMERNLAFVDTTSTPMRHQFELELDMWRLLTNDMQRRLRRAERAK